MSILFLEYPKCTTCKKAKAWLEASDVAFADRHIVEENPSAAELGEWWKKSGLLYKEQGLKDKLPLMDEQSQLELLATNGMLVKRPLVIGEDFVLVGFKESEWAETLKP